MVLCRKRFGETAFGRLFQVKLELGREPGTEASSITHVVLTHAEQRNVLLICQVSDGETCLNVEVIRNLRRPIDAYGVQGVASKWVAAYPGNGTVSPPLAQWSRYQGSSWAAAIL